LYLSGAPTPNANPVESVPIGLKAPRSTRPLTKSVSQYWPLTRNEPKVALGLTGKLNAAPACNFSMTPMLKPKFSDSPVVDSDMLVSGLVTEKLLIPRSNSGSASIGARISGRSRNELQLPLSIPGAGVAVAVPAGGVCAFGSPAAGSCANAAGAIRSTL